MRTGAALLVSLLLAAPIAQAAEPVATGVAEIDFQDSSGAPDAQAAVHAEWTKKFAAALRRDLAAGGKFKIVPLDCGKGPCSVANQVPEDLIAAAKQAGARLLIYGGVNKASPLLQNMTAQAIDVEADRLVFDRTITFRGDDAASWDRAERFLADALLKAMLDK